MSFAIHIISQWTSVPVVGQNILGTSGFVGPGGGTYNNAFTFLSAGKYIASYPHHDAN